MASNKPYVLLADYCLFGFLPMVLGSRQTAAGWLAGRPAKKLEEQDVQEDEHQPNGGPVRGFTVD